MSKVKKRAALTGVRNLRSAPRAGGRGAKKASAVGKRPAKRPGSTPAAKGAKAAGKRARNAPSPVAAKEGARGTKKAVKKVGRKVERKVERKVATKGRAKVAKRGALTLVAGRPASRGRLAPIVRFAIKELDPIRKCGPDTSVQFLYRVDESVEGKTTAHLVFFDRHGWYCEHGRTCPAVAPARKHNGHIARVS